MYTNKQLVNSITQNQNDKAVKTALKSIANSHQEMESLQVTEGKIVVLADKIAKSIPGFSKQKIINIMVQTEYESCMSCTDKTLEGWCDAQRLILRYALAKNINQ